jgi:hypothetical protein
MQLFWITRTIVHKTLGEAPNPDVAVAYSVSDRYYEHHDARQRDGYEPIRDTTLVSQAATHPREHGGQAPVPDITLDEEGNEIDE